MTKHIELKKANHKNSAGDRLAGVAALADRRTRGVQGQLRPSVPPCSDCGHRSDASG